MLGNSSEKNIDLNSDSQANINTQPEKPFTGKHIKKKPLIAISLILIFLLLFNLLSPTSSRKGEEERVGDTVREKIHITDTVGDLPSSYSELKKNEPVKIVKAEEVPPSVSQIQNDVNNNPNNTENRNYSMEQQEALRLQRQQAEQAKRSNINFKGFENRNTANIIQSPQNSYPSVDFDSNRQGSKKGFLKNEAAEPFYLSSVKSKPISAYEVKAGNIIPGVLITGINSDLPGSIVGQVRENVFDSATGNYLLIPQGARLIGTYDSGVTWGQDRVLIVWQRLLFPNGESINLENMPGVDLSGYAGFTDKVNNHFGTLLKGVLLSSMMGATSAIVTGENGSDYSWGAEAGRGAGQVIVEVGNKFAQKALERQPTIEIRQGYRFNVLVHRDMVLTPYKN